ncbi:hypothetical protein ACQ4PT_025813 [Festuca glaucescens]
MAWIWMFPAAGAVLLWAVSLGRILSPSAPYSLPPSPRFPLPLRGDRRTRNVLLVLAHPDDESMYVAPLSSSPLLGARKVLDENHVSSDSRGKLRRFFTPTILFLKSKGHSIHILCMSLGNADGLGNIRKEELYKACATLKDGFQEKWDHRLLAELTMEQIHLWDIDTIVTFDSYGVSGHPNHRDVHHGISKLLHENQQGNIEAWELVSLNMFRKYSGPVDIWLSSLISSSSKQPMCCLVNCTPSRTFEAMAAHRSQWVWFRRLFVRFSSYTYMNMLRKI